MNLKSKKLPLMILGITSILCSRMMFLFFNDPEGPNLLVVFGMAAILFIPSLAVYKFAASNIKRLSLAICSQVLIAAILYFFLS